jgi:hypothetical protein
MKNLFTFYLTILAPLAAIIWLSRENIIEGWVLVAVLIGYAVIYRTYTDGKRLIEKNVLQERDLWKMIMPGMRSRYFIQLYWV